MAESRPFLKAVASATSIEALLRSKAPTWIKLLSQLSITNLAAVLKGDLEPSKLTFKNPPGGLNQGMCTVHFDVQIGGMEDEMDGSW